VVEANATSAICRSPDLLIPPNSFQYIGPSQKKTNTKYFKSILNPPIEVVLLYIHPVSQQEGCTFIPINTSRCSFLELIQTRNKISNIISALDYYCNIVRVSCKFHWGLFWETWDTNTTQLFLSITSRGSMEIEYRRPNRGHPCLIPLVTEKGLVKDPLIHNIL